MKRSDYTTSSSKNSPNHILKQRKNTKPTSWNKLPCKAFRKRTRNISVVIPHHVYHTPLKYSFLEYPTKSWALSIFWTKIFPYQG